MFFAGEKKWTFRRLLTLEMYGFMCQLRRRCGNRVMTGRPLVELSCIEREYGQMIEAEAARCVCHVCIEWHQVTFRKAARAGFGGNGGDADQDPGSNKANRERPCCDAGSDTIRPHYVLLVPRGYCKTKDEQFLGREKSGCGLLLNRF